MPEPLAMRDRRSLRRIAGLDTLGTRRATSRETMRETKRATAILGLLGTIRIQGFGVSGLRVKRIQTSLKIFALVCWLFLLGSLVVSVVCDVFFFVGVFGSLGLTWGLGLGEGRGPTRKQINPAM